jgi:hypothetical protein
MTKNDEATLYLPHLIYRVKNEGLCKVEIVKYLSSNTTQEQSTDPSSF